MKKTRHSLNRCLLGSLAATLICCTANLASAATIGTPSITTTVGTIDLTHLNPLGTLDWQVLTSSTNAYAYESGGSSIANLTGVVTNGAANVTVDGVDRVHATYAWSDGVPPNSSTNSYDPSGPGWRIAGTQGAFALGLDYETFKFVPGDTNAHTVYIYGYGTNGSLFTYQFENSLPNATSVTNTTANYPGVDWVYSVQFQADNPTDALTVKFNLAKTASGGGLAWVGIEAVAILNYTPTLNVWNGSVSTNWDTTTANWNSPTTYADGAVGVQFDDTASRFSVYVVPSTVSPLITYVNNTANSYTIGGSPIAGSGTLLKTGTNTLTLSGANTFSGGINVSGGYLTLGASGTLPNGSGAGNVAIGSGATLDLHGFNQTLNGLNGAGTVDIPNSSGGTSTLTVGNNNASGNFSGNIQNTYGTVGLIKTGNGTLTLSGSNTFSGGVQLNAGQLNINSTNAIGTGTLTIAGSTTLNNTSGGTKTMGGANPQNWNGDFTVLGSSSLFMGSGAVTMSASRVITVNSNTFSVGGVISGSGYGLTKNGAGQLSATGSNTFSGPIVVNAGTLLLNTTTTGGGALTLAPGANLQVNLSTNEATLNVASLSLQGTNASSTNNVTFNFNNNTNNANAIVTSAGTLTTSNNVVINIQVGAGPTLTPGQYPLIKYTGSIAGAGFSAFSLGSTPVNSIMSLADNSANHSVDILITVIAGPAKTWVGYTNGAASSTWDINNTTNWIAFGATSQGPYLETGVAGDTVQFTDSASNFVVNVAQAVRPTVITVNNTNHDYVINATQPITSITSLSKQGTKALTLSGDNTFSNGVTISGGTVRIGSGSSPLGTGLLNLFSAGVGLSSDGTSARTVTNAVLIGKGFYLGDSNNNGTMTLSGPINLGANNWQISLLSDAVINGTSTNGSINLASTYTNTPTAAGTNTLTLRGVHNWNQINSILSGTLLLDGALVTNSFSTGTFVPIGVNQTNGLARLIITNGAAFVCTGTNVEPFMGYNAFGGNTAGGQASSATNELDLSGVFATPNSTNRVVMGRDCLLAVINLLPNGYMKVAGLRYSNKSADVNPTLVNFNGGTLSPTANSDDFMPYQLYTTTANVLAGGAFFDTDGWGITNNQPLLDGGGGGGLTKNGNGMLALFGANTYTGTTTVNRGELYMPTTATGGGTIVVADPGSLGVKVLAQDAYLYASSITLGSTSAHNGTLDIDFGGFAPTATATGPLTTPGALSVSGTNTINISCTNQLSIGQVALIKYGGSPLTTPQFNSFRLGSLPVGVGAVLTNNTGNLSIDLKVTINTIPGISGVNFSGGNLNFSGTNGTPSGAYSVVTSTNLTKPIASWTTVTTGNFDGTGACSVSIPVNYATPGSFYLIKE